MQTVRQTTFKITAVILSLFILAEVNYPRLVPQSQLAIFAMLGLILVFLKYPLHRRLETRRFFQAVDLIFIAGVIICFGYILVQSEPFFQVYWQEGQPLGNRAGMETPADYLFGLLGLLLVIEATRRAIGITLPVLSLAFVGYAALGPEMPGWLFPHRGYSWERIVSQTFLHSQGVFGVALKVMFTYVFLFVLFGALLENTGATGYIINFARRLFRGRAGGPAKVAVISSGMMGSLSGSAVANTATTGTFTIPMMRSAGFKPAVAAGLEAAASSGGALVPPIMGAGAYMMLEIVEPPVTYLEIIKAATLPAILYYLALLLIVHFQSQKVSESPGIEEDTIESGAKFPGVVFFSAFITLIFFLVIGYTPFRAVSLSLILILAVSTFHPSTRINLSGIVNAMEKAAHGGVALIAAASCVGIIIGVVTLTGIGTKLPGTILPLAQNNLLLALLLLMISTIILGMGLPSAVCYLLVATLIGPVLGNMGVVPLAAHLFVFYFGMMSMVTPPVALAAYTAAAIADAGIMRSGFAAFRFALIGFALPYTFVLRPELLLLAPNGGPATLTAVLFNLIITLIAIVALAASVSGYWWSKLRYWQRGLLFCAALIFLLTHSAETQIWLQAAALAIVLLVAFLGWQNRFPSRWGKLNADKADKSDFQGM